MKIRIVNSEKEPLFVDMVKKAIAKLPDKGGEWDVENPQEIVAGLENILSRLSDGLALLKANAKEDSCNMKDEYPDEDKPMMKALDDLFNEWVNAQSDDDKGLFNRDGFYPGYCLQKVKILFVGREACYMAGKNYIEYMYGRLRGGYIGKWTVNQYPFHRRQAYIAYGILKALEGNQEWQWPSWDAIPSAFDICKNVGENISWAFMNLSKLSNETGDWRTDGNKYWPFVKNNKRWLREQVRILNPDIIIGANVPELADILKYEMSPDAGNGKCYVYYKEGLPLFLNCYHFSAIKGDEDFFYAPVGDVLGKYRNNLKKAIENRNKRCWSK